MGFKLVAQFLMVLVVYDQKYSEAALAGFGSLTGQRAQVWDAFPETETATESTRDLHDDILREALQLMWNQRLQITLAKQQLYRIYGQTGPTPNVAQVLDSLDKMLEEKTNLLKDKLSVELLTNDFTEEPILKSAFDMMSKSWRQVKSILLEEKSSRFSTQVPSLLRWLDKVDLEMAMQYSTVEGLITKMKLVSP